MNPEVTVVGAGFAGVEAAWFLASRGVSVRLVEMRPSEMTPAHTTGYFGELVCSNSFKSKNPDSPAGLLKCEMDALGSLVLETARMHEVPGGQALAVDRAGFGEGLTARIQGHSGILVEERRFGAVELEERLNRGEIVVLATGPLTTEDISGWLARTCGRDQLYFYDAVSPTVEAASLDREVIFAQSRYDHGDGDDYLNCPFEKSHYEAFVEGLIGAEKAPFSAFEAGGKRDGGSEGLEEALLEKIKYFAGCTPIEEIASKGKESLRYGNFKPVGLTDPRTGRRPYAALQLRPENKEKTLYSLVACQTRLRWAEQKRVFGLVPGLERAEFVRFGVIHRNTYVDAPQVLASDLSLRGAGGCFLAGQLTGVEGYVESAAFGILAGISVLCRLRGVLMPMPPRATAYGSLLSHLSDETPREFAPMNINWGLLPEPEAVFEKKRNKGLVRERKLASARASMEDWLGSLGAVLGGLGGGYA